MGKFNQNFIPYKSQNIDLLKLNDYLSRQINYFFQFQISKITCAKFVIIFLRRLCFVSDLYRVRFFILAFTIKKKKDTQEFLEFIYHKIKKHLFIKKFIF
eukprot:TRINITY_DN793_c1_g1_i3.p3 TRINITY_DN793_c1_g1~~TRINITY_DN793_c1_g1_i3.p3  ORF type:complete len:100 (+),score=0.88 TRINITY_DN793_c1_g1_i3:248-547(+)